MIGDFYRYIAECTVHKTEEAEITSLSSDKIEEAKTDILSSENIEKAKNAALSYYK